MLGIIQDLVGHDEKIPNFGYFLRPTFDQKFQYVMHLLKAFCCYIMKIQTFLNYYRKCHLNRSNFNFQVECTAILRQKEASNIEFISSKSHLKQLTLKLCLISKVKLIFEPGFLYLTRSLIMILGIYFFLGFGPWPGP